MRTRLVSVVGSGKGLSKEQIELAQALGEALTRAGFGLVCGGLHGIMEAAAHGAVRGRGGKHWPPVVGLLPSYDVESGSDDLDLVIPTGLGHARNTLVAAAGEVLVCIGGATGALSEVAMACKIKRPVIAFVRTGGTAHLVGKAIASVEAVQTVEEAMTRIHAHLG